MRSQLSHQPGPALEHCIRAVQLITTIYSHLLRQEPRNPPLKPVVLALYYSFVMLSTILLPSSHAYTVNRTSKSLIKKWRCVVLYETNALWVNTSIHFRVFTLGAACAHSDSERESDRKLFISGADGLHCATKSVSQYDRRFHGRTGPSDTRGKKS